MIKADGTKDKSNLGANAVLAVSIAAEEEQLQSHLTFLFIDSSVESQETSFQFQ